MGKMKNIQLLENCFADSENIEEVVKLEEISSKLIRQNSRLQKEKEQLARQARKQEVCISHLLKKLESASDLAKDQQSNFDEALQQHTATVSSMLQELAKSRNEIVQLRNELALEKSKSKDLATRQAAMEKIHRIPMEDNNDEDDEELLDISDEITVPTTNIVSEEKQAMAVEANSLSKGFQYPMPLQQPQQQQRQELLQDLPSRDSLSRATVHGTPSRRSRGNGAPRRMLKARTRSSWNVPEPRMHRDRFRPDDNIEMPHRPFVQAAALPPPPTATSMGSKMKPRSGLQEVDSEAPRPPLNRQASGVRGSPPQSTLPLRGLERSDSRSFCMEAVNYAARSRSLSS